MAIPVQEPPFRLQPEITKGVRHREERAKLFLTAEDGRRYLVIIDGEKLYKLDLLDIVEQAFHVRS